jgi:hypothetical protein
MNAGFNGILEKLRENTLMQDTFLNEFRVPSPKGLVGSIHKSTPDLKKGNRAKSISPSLSPVPMKIKKKHYNSPDLTVKKRNNS